MAKTFDFTRKNKKTGKIENVGTMKFNELTDETAELRFYGDICSASWQSSFFEDDQSPQDVSDFLSDIGRSKKLSVYVNSGGGDVNGGIAIYNILKRYEGEKTAYIDGIAASIASIIPFACDRIVYTSSSQMMIHKPWAAFEGNADDMRKCAEALDSCQKAIMAIYVEHAADGVTEEQIEQMINNETWLTGAEVAQFFDVEVEETVAAVACAKSHYFNKYRNLPENLTEKTTPEPTPIPPNSGDDGTKLKERLQLWHDCLML